jgi:hypothetical protein
MHASGDSPCHASAKRHLLEACFLLIPPFRSMLLTLQSGLESLAPRAHRIPVYPRCFRTFLPAAFTTHGHECFDDSAQGLRTQQVVGNDHGHATSALRDESSSTGVDGAGFSAHSIRQSRCARQMEERESRIENAALLPQGLCFQSVFCMVHSALGDTFQPQRGIIHRISATPKADYAH